MLLYHNVTDSFGRTIYLRAKAAAVLSKHEPKRCGNVPTEQVPNLVL